MSPVSQYTRTKSPPPLVLFKTKFSASQRVSKRQIFSESPPTGINCFSIQRAGVAAYNRGQERRGTKMRAETHQDKVTIFQTALSEKIRAHVGLHKVNKISKFNGPNRAPPGTDLRTSVSGLPELKNEISASRLRQRKISR